MIQQDNNAQVNGRMHMEFDSNGTLVEVTEGIDGVRTRMKFIYGIPGLDIPMTGSTSNGNVTMDAMDDGEADSSTPRGSPLPDDLSVALLTPQTERRARSGSFSSKTSGPLGINHWARHAPIVDSPNWGPGSDLSTEIILNNEPERMRMSPPRSAKSMSHFSGTTQAPTSLGHAKPGSAFHAYQQNGHPTFECEDPGIRMRAEALVAIQRCDAANRNLGDESVPNDVCFSSIEVLSPSSTDRFTSPSPSGQIRAPSRFSRESTPANMSSESLKENYHRLLESSFDIMQWTYPPSAKVWLSDNSSTPSNETIKVEPMSPRLQFDDPGIMEQQQDNPAVQTSGHRSLGVSGFFSRENSPLTEYDYSVKDVQESVKTGLGISGFFSRECSPLTEYDDDSDMDVQEHVYNLRPRPLSPPKNKQLPTPQTSPTKGYKRTGPIVTHKRAQKTASRHH